jgi:hypothetical protein
MHPIELSVIMPAYDEERAIEASLPSQRNFGLE